MEAASGHHHVLDADGGEATKRIAEQHQRIDLLLTDVKMPNIKRPGVGDVFERSLPGP